MHFKDALRFGLAISLTLCGCVGGDDDSSGGDAGGGSGGIGGSSGGGGSGDGGVGGALGCDSADHCGADGFVCGVHAVAACGEVDCGPCRYAAHDVGWGDVTAASDRSIHLAFFSPIARELVYARVGATGLEQQTVAAVTNGEAAAIAVADDGTVHVVFTDTQVMHASKAPSASTWDVQMVADSAESVLIAVDADDAPHIFLLAEHAQTRQRQLIHVTRSGSTYTATPFETVMPVGDATVARGADGSIVVAVRSNIRELAVLELIDGQLVRDDNVPELEDQPAEVSAAISADGDIELAVLLGNYTLITGSQLIALSRRNGTWTSAPLLQSGIQVTHGIASALGPTDSTHVAYFARNDDGLQYTRAGSTQTLNMHPQCDEGLVRIAIDADDQPHVLYRCDSGDVRYMAPAERYADAYTDACREGAELICDRACVCGEPDCCYGDTGAGDNGGCFFGPGDAGHTLCVADMTIGLCGDLAAAPEPLLACKPLLDADSGMCVETKYGIPDACWQLIQANR